MTYVRANSVVVYFPIYGAKSRSLKHTMIRAATGGALAKDAADRVVVRALDNVSFDLREGDRVGLVGHNGSGKTTLLRAIAGIYEPSEGSLETRGRIASMLSVSVGMEMEATGYENIFMRGTIMGLTRREIANKVDEICEFSELGEYLDMPMRTYSSGMSMRLAFAISTSTNADILLMDEWLSVGDASFAEKAQKRLTDMVGRAKILVLASHNLELVKSNCTRIIYLEHGRVARET